MATHQEIRQRKRDIREACENGEPIEDVCKRFNVEIEYVFGCLNSDLKKILKKEIKLTRKNFQTIVHTEEVQKILDLATMGKTAEIISSELNIGQSKVERVIKNAMRDKERIDKRNAAERRLDEIVRQASCGKPMREIGESLGISGERVRRLLLEAGISVRDLRKADNSKFDQVANEVSAWISKHPGCTKDEILKRFEIDSELFSSLNLKSKAIRLILQEESPSRNSSNLKFTREEMLQSLRTAYEIRNPMIGMFSIDQVRPLTGPFYEKLRRSGRITGPSLMRILQVLGTWRIACSLANVVSVAPVRSEYELRWTRDELVQMLADFILASESHSVDAFDMWCRLDESRPSSGTIRNQVGSWSSAKREALIALRDTWLPLED